MQPGRHFVIADPGLNGPAGHHLSYTAAVAGAALDAGLAPMVLAGRGFTGGLEGGRVPARAVLGATYQSAGGGGLARQLAFGLAARLPAPLAGLVAPPLRALRRRLRRAGASDSLGRELAAELAALGAGEGDALLLHSVSGANLHSVATTPGFPPVTLLVVLRRMPAEMEADDPAPERLPALLARLQARFGGALRLFADTEQLAAEFAALSGLVVRPVPLPVVVPPLVPRTAGQPPHVVFAGGARAEKGFSQLPEAIAAVAGRARFTVQSGRVGADSDPLVQRAHRLLRARADVTLIEHALNPADYAALLAGADLLLLPYDGAVYGARSSGILAEALALGTPAVVPAGCWMADAAGPDRAVLIPRGAPPGAALAAALARLPQLAAAAREAAQQWRDRHNPDSLLRALVAPPLSSTPD
ncbi:glycosyltransferase [Falsiroseomonas sp.]|uniref:glycosyltransferase n=1 Tax=Falsiroseomonas sp. TaxID=2870721 RepID=UPI003F6F8FAE